VGPFRGVSLPAPGAGQRVRHAGNPVDPLGDGPRLPIADHYMKSQGFIGRTSRTDERLGPLGVQAVWAGATDRVGIDPGMLLVSPFPSLAHGIRWRLQW